VGPVGFVGGVSVGEQGPSGAARGQHTVANRDGGGGHEHVYAAHKISVLPYTTIKRLCNLGFPHIEKFLTITHRLV
jgi:hypothetical protein